VRAARDRGANVLVALRVARREDVARVLADIERRLPELKGVMHAAGILEDGVLEQQPWERFAAVFPAKLQGAWNLHALTQQADIDFFVMFSSVAAVTGSPGQGGYCAANACLDTRTKGSSGAVCSEIIFGNFADLVIALWGGIEFMINPYSLDTTGLTRINAAVYYDGGVVRPVSFAAMLDALAA
jgi:hypothetical protein